MSEQAAGASPTARVWANVLDELCTLGALAVAGYALAGMMFWSETPPSNYLLWWTIALSFFGAASKCQDRIEKRKCP